MSRRQPQIRVYFGDRVLEAGWMMIPHLLNRHYTELGLTPELLVFILQLMAMRFDLADPPTNLPDIARRMGKGISTVRSYSHRLNEAGLLIIRERWKDGQQIGNDYDLSPLWARLAEFADDDVRDEAESGITVGPPVQAGQRQPKHAEQTFRTRQESGGGAARILAGQGRRNPGRLGSQDPGRLGSQDPGGFKRNQEDQQALTSDAAAAAELFSTLVARHFAEHLVAKYPASVPHAAAIMDEVRRRARTNPPGFLIYLIESGWAPPLPQTAPRPAAPDAAEMERAGIWQAVLRCLRQELDAQAFSTWLAGTVLLALDDGTAVVGAGNVFVRDELANHYTMEIAAALTAELGEPLDVEIVIADRP